VRSLVFCQIFLGENSSGCDFLGESLCISDFFRRAPWHLCDIGSYDFLHEVLSTSDLKKYV
jgi:hypothetical protein